jgi:hypothetical protein
MSQSTAALKRIKEPQWRMLKLMAGLLMAMACLILIAGVALAIVQVLVMTNVVNLRLLPIPPGIGLSISSISLASTLLGTALGFILCAAIAELMLVLVAIEHNTRQRRF